MIVPKSVYIAGPMEHYPDLNKPAFHEAAHFLRNAGYKVLSPAENDPNETCPDCLGVEGVTTCARCEDSGEIERTWIEHMWFDIGLVQRVDALVMLPRWRESRGAMIEACLAHFFGKPIFEYGAVIDDAGVNLRRVEQEFVAPVIFRIPTKWGVKAP